MKIEKLCNINLKEKNLAIDGATCPRQVRDLNIVKTKRNSSKITSHIKKRRPCNRCKRVGHTI